MVESKKMEPGAEVVIVWEDETEVGFYLGLGMGEVYRFAISDGRQIYVNPRSALLKYMTTIRE